MLDLLPLSVGIGLAIGILFTEFFGLATGGMIVPGYIALYLTKPLDVAMTLGVGYLTFATVRAISTFLIIYGRRRTMLMVLLGYILGMLANRYSGLGSAEYDVIGFIIPGLIALWMDRQGVLQTIAALLTVSVVVRLILILVVGSEGML